VKLFARAVIVVALDDCFPRFFPLDFVISEEGGLLEFDEFLFSRLSRVRNRASIPSRRSTTASGPAAYTANASAGVMARGFFFFASPSFSFVLVTPCGATILFSWHYTG